MNLRLVSPAQAPPQPQPDNLFGSEYDVGVGFVRDHGEDWRYRPGFGFLEWSGSAWEPDRRKALLSALMAYGREHYGTLSKEDIVPDPRTGGRAGTARGASIVVTDRTATDPAAWDADPEVLACRTVCSATCGRATCDRGPATT